MSAVGYTGFKSATAIINERFTQNSTTSSGKFKDTMMGDDKGGTNP
jgi:hypothetical protein